MIEVLLVSKPITPPWNDSGKNLVRDLIRHCPDMALHVLTTPGTTFDLDHVTAETVYGATGRFAPGLVQNARVLLRLLRPDRQSIYHFFFAPNPRTSSMARRVTTLKRRTTVQTVMSVPASFENVERLIFADRVVTLSEHTTQQLAAAGVPGLVHIPPGIDPPPPLTDGERARARQELGLPLDRPVVVFPGDYEFSQAAHTLAEAIPRVLEHVDATFVYACRMKREASRASGEEIQRRLAPQAERGRVLFLGETRRIRELLSCADLVILPSESTYAKMDIPLVLLEALAEHTPILVADVAPLNEVLGTAAHAPPSPVGRAVAPLDPQALADGIGELISAPDDLGAMGTAGAAWVNERFHARSMGAAHVDLYRSL